MSTKTAKPSLAYIVSGSGAISLVLNNKSYSIQPDFPSYASVREALNKKDAKKLLKLVDVGQSIKVFTKGVCRVKDGVVLYNDKPVSGVATDRILTLMRKGFAVDSMLRFLENAMSNPSFKAIDELYLFLESGEIPITEDGCFLAYKRLDKNFKSKHASPDGTYMDHTIGTKPEMKREEVDPDRHRTCSKGLHFCSLQYLPKYGSDANGDKTVIVKVNPADVVAIPSDYNNSKGRAWKYEVIAEHTLGEKTDAFDQPVYAASVQYGIKPSGQKFYSVRDGKGKFVKKKN